VIFPASLSELNLDNNFPLSFAGVSFPPSLKKLRFYAPWYE